MEPRLLATMVTTTSYGSWLPGDLRGFVDNGIILPGDPSKLALATRRMAGREHVFFTRAQQALAIGRIWTEGYYDSRLFETSAIDARQRYIGRHAGCRMSGGTLVARIDEH